MSIIFDLPPELEQRLRAQSPNLNAQAKEDMLVEQYRQDKITHHELSLALGLDRFQIDALLKKHNVTEDLLSKEDYEAALAHLNTAGQS